VNRNKFGKRATGALVAAAALAAAVSMAACGSAPAAKREGKAGATSATLAMEKARANLDIATPPKRAEKRPFLMTHYMPWFEAPPVSKNYGWHWHMGYTDPFQTDARGYAQIATHYYPLTGPYDSTDKDILEYQTLLMKIAGIDGVIIDWYGVGPVLDYPVVHKASQALFAQVKKAGLKFAVCYEDQSVGKMVEARAIPIDQSIAAAKESLSWAMANWMKDPAYLTLADRPLLLDFGPQYAKLVMPSAWDQVFAGMAPKPFFDTLDSHMESTADGSFAWPPMYLSGGGTLTPTALADYLNEFYRKQADNSHLVTSAFPGFYDYYSDAHVAKSYGYLDDLGGEILRLTLEAAAKARPDVVQLVTWNDYGEGTIIEPTVQKGYRDLETVQDFRRSYEPAFPYTKADLRIPLEVFKLRIDPKLAADKAAGLDALYAAVAGGDAAGAEKIARDLGIAK
jgi:hypothetical protein